MRIGIVVPYDLAEEGGVKRHAVQLAAALREQGDEVDVIGPSSRSDGRSDGLIGFSGVASIPNNGSENHIGVFVDPLRVRALMRARNYDVVHVHEPLVPAINWWASWSAGAAARIATFHAFSETEGALARQIRRLTGRVACRGYARGIAVSPAAARFAAACFGGPLTIIPNGIEHRRPAPRYAAAGGPLRLLFVGHWRDARKGLPVLLEAVRRLDAAWTLDVVGDGGGHRPVELPGVRYHGAIADPAAMAAQYDACDVFVAPSIGMESFGIVLLEAMAAGRAIVCSDLEGYRYAVGDAALRVPPGSAEALAGALGALAADVAKRSRLAMAGQARVPQFAWDKLARRVRAEYLEAVRGDHTAIPSR